MKSIFFLIAICLSANIAFAQTSNKIKPENAYRAVHWGLDEGLSQAEVYFTIKDINGFLWVGSRHGLNRFDGKKFKIFYHNSRDSSSISGNVIHNGLVEDSLHNIWIGTEHGITRYNIKKETFTNFLPDTSIVKSGILTIYPFWATPHEVFCIEGEAVITAYNILTSSKRVLATLSGINGFNGPAAGYSIYDSTSNSLWFLVEDQIKNQRELLQISLLDKTRNVYVLPLVAKKNSTNGAEAMCFDAKRNCIWINSDNGLMQFTLHDKQYHHIDALKEIESQKDYRRFVGITLDVKGRIWFATDPKGIVIYDPSDQSVQYPFPNDSTLQKEVSGENACLYCDRDGIMWIGTWLRKGFYQILPFSPSVKHYHESDAAATSLHAYGIINFLDAGDGKLWIGSFQGLHIFDPRTNIFQSISKNELPGIKGNIIIPLLNDSITNNVILLNSDGLFKLDITAGKSQSVLFKDIENREIKVMENGSTSTDNDVYIVGNYDNKQSIFRITKNDLGTAREILSFLPNSIAFLGVFAIKDYLFIHMNSESSGNITYKHHENKWVRSPNPLDSVYWNYIAYDQKDQSYWVAAQRELFHYNKDFKIIHSYHSSDGLPDLEIFSIAPDNNGNVWFNTDRSIHQLNVETGIFSTLSEKDGFQPMGFTSGPSLKLGADGTLFLGGGIFGEGFVRIYPDKYKSTAASVYIQSLQINQKPFPLSTGVNDLQELSLRYFQNKITIETGIIDHYSSGKNQLRYKLEREGKKEGWLYAPDYYTIRYEGLLPGEYKLIMQASNSSNEFSGPEKIVFIHISPPFWETWWFRLFAAFIVIAATYGIIQYRSRSLRQRNMQLEEKVTLRTNELKLSLEDLKATQTQLIHSEKMASLGELTAGIAHEIQNPLNFVNNFSEINKELIEELKNQKLKIKNERDDTLEIDLLNVIEQNEEKINHHGKRADAIVKGMLQHGRASTGQKEPTDINALADEYLRLSYHGLRAKDKSFNATMKTDFDRSLPKINIIPQDIGRVILNLLNNAFYSVNEQAKSLTRERELTSSNKLEDEKYEPTVSISTKKVVDKVEIKVTDNGSGIPNEIKDKIFQPFFTTKPSGQGTGLGLSLAYDIIKAHGGTIIINSSSEARPDDPVGRGSTFQILLPIQ
ncbi:MAG: ATP-binding protein [Saprospiraceae bacterium]